MTHPNPRVKPLAQQRAERLLDPAEKPVTVIGLDGIGRQVAVQLAALGVPSLQLVDSRIVTRGRQRAEGYGHEDLGRPRVHAVAQACHEISPQMEIHTAVLRTLKGLDPGRAVFCCSALPSVWRRLLAITRGRPVFLAGCWTDGSAVHIVAASSAETAWPSRPPIAVGRLRRTVAVPLHAAAVAAGLAVGEFIRFTGGHFRTRAIRFDLRTLKLQIRDVA